MTRRVVFAVLLAALFVQSACLPVPVLIPPTKLDGGVSLGGPADPEPVTFPLRAGVHVMHLLDAEQVRRFDAAPGWSFFPNVEGGFVHGPYIEGGLLWAQEGGVRWGSNLKQHYLLGAPGVDRQFMTSLQGTVEWASWANGEDASDSDCSGEGCAILLALGEAGVGAFVEASVAYGAGAPQFWVSTGVLVRTPLVFGVLLAPLF
jgi:hypothetical protein